MVSEGGACYGPLRVCLHVLTVMWSCRAVEVSSSLLCHPD